MFTGAWPGRHPTFKVTTEFEVADHIGGIVWDADRASLVGLSWGSRTFYDWTTTGDQLATWQNPSDFVDYQDCQYLADSKAMCTGIAEIPGMPGTPEGQNYKLGGLAVVDLAGQTIVKETPLQQFSENSRVLTQNPSFAQMTDGGLELLTAPDDGEDPGGARLYSTVTTPRS